MAARVRLWCCCAAVDQASPMNPLIHLLCTLTLVPYAVLMAWFLLVGRIAASTSPWDMVDTLAYTANWFLWWGVAAFAASFLVLAGMGFVARLRRLALLTLLTVSLAILLGILFYPDKAVGGGELLFLLPCFLVVGLAAWRAFKPG